MGFQGSDLDFFPDGLQKNVVLNLYLRRWLTLKPLMKNAIVVLIVLVATHLPRVHAQDIVMGDDIILDESLGFGLGIDYGGVGAKFMAPVAKKVSVMAGVGYNLNDIGFNAGVTYYPLSPSLEKTVRPIIVGMYGYNAVILTDSRKEPASIFNKTYYGPSLGAGFEYHPKSSDGNFLSIEVLFPFRPKKFDEKLDEAEALGVNTMVYPVYVSVGYHFAR